MPQNDRMECYGRLWSWNATECTGGYDISYTGPNGTHIRPRCDCFEQCGHLYKNKTNLQEPRPAYGQPAYPTPPHSVPIAYPAPTQQTVVRQMLPTAPQPARPAYPTYPQQYQPPPVQQQQHGYYGIQASAVAQPMEMMPRNWFTTPSVLGQHEPRQDRPWASLGMEVFRGACMIAGLISADFFSNVTLLKKKE